MTVANPPAITQAVVLCGAGGRLGPLVDDARLPKALVPVNGEPMLRRVLDWLLAARGIEGG